MNLYLPSFNVKVKREALEKKILKSKIVKGIYKGYNFSQNVVITLFKGHVGWNLFFNSDSDHINEVLYFIIKNKKSILFIMSHMDEGTINFIESNR